MSDIDPLATFVSRIEARCAAPAIAIRARAVDGSLAALWNRSRDPAAMLALLAHVGGDSLAREVDRVLTQTGWRGAHGHEVAATGSKRLYAFPLGLPRDATFFV